MREYFDVESAVLHLVHAVRGDNGVLLDAR
jgi:hypothetical protein